MRENIRFRPPREIEPRARGQKVETGGGEGVAPLARQHDVELRLKLVQMQHVRGGVNLLRLRQGLRAPVRGLLLLGDFDPQQFAREIL